MMNMIRNYRSRIISLVLCALMCVSVFPFGMSVSAAGTVAKIGSQSYDSLSSAVAAAYDGATVNIVGDIASGENVRFDKSVILTAQERHSVVCGGFEIASGGSLTVVGPVCIGSDSTSEPVRVNGGTFILRSGAQVASADTAVNASSGSVYLMGGSLSGLGTIVRIGSGAELKLSGDVSFSGGTSVSLADGRYVEIAGTMNGTGKISIALTAGRGDSRIGYISGGAELSDAQLERFVVTGDTERTVYLSGNSLFASDDGDGSTAEARCNGVEYASLLRAFDVAPENESSTIELLRDVVLEHTVTVENKNITLVSKGDHIINRSSANRFDIMFDVKSGASLTLGTDGGKLTISGTGMTATMPVFSAGGTVTIGANTVISDHTNNNPNVFYQGVLFIPAGGRAVMNGGCFSSNDTNNGTVLVYGGSFAMNGGSLNDNTTKYGGGVCVYSGSFAMSGGSIYKNSATSAGGAVWCNGTFALSGSAAILSDTVHKSDVYLAKDKVISLSPSWKPANVSGYSNIVNINPESTARDTKIAVLDSGKATDEIAKMFTLYGELGDDNGIRPLDNFLYIGAPGQGTITVYVDGKGYSTLKDAFEAVTVREKAVEVYITGDVEVAETAVLQKGKNVILIDARDPVANSDYKERTIKRSPAFDGSLISVLEGASLSITSSAGAKLTIDGKGVDAVSAMIFDLGTLTMSGNVTLIGNKASKGEVLGGNAPSYTTGGAVFVGENGVFTMNGGTIRENYATQGGGVCVMNGKFTLNAGTVTENKAVFGAGVILLDTKAENNRLSFEKNIKTVKETENAGNDNNGNNGNAQNNQSAQTQPTQVDPKTTENAVFEMFGGEITSNKALVSDSQKIDGGYGGGVCIGNAASFTVKGGSIKGNTAIKGGSVCVGLKYAEKESKDRVPMFSLFNGVSFGDDCDIFLLHRNDSRVVIKEKLEGIDKDSPIVVSASSDASVNSVLCTFALNDKNEAEDQAEARLALRDGTVVMCEAQKELYTLAVSTERFADLVNAVDDEDAFGFAGGRSYDGLEKYLPEDEAPDESEETADGEETTSAETQKPEEKSSDEKQSEEEKEEKEKIPVKYDRFKLIPDGTFTVTSRQSWHSELYTDVETFIYGAFPKGTAITMVDGNASGADSVYYYIVTGKETVYRNGQALDAIKLAADEGNEEIKAKTDTALLADQKTLIGYIEISVNDFVKISGKEESYKLSEAKKNDDGKLLPVSEDLTFIIDYSCAETGKKEILLGEYRFGVSRYFTAANGEKGDMCDNSGVAEYKVTEEELATVKLTSGEKGTFKINYTLTSSASVCVADTGVVLVTMEGGYPAGTVIIYNDEAYPVFASEDTIAIPLPKDKKGGVLLRGKLELKLANYFGVGIPDANVNVRLCASRDGIHPISALPDDAKSENVTLTLPAADVYAICISDADGNKPYYDKKQLKVARSVSFTVVANCNGRSCDNFEFYVEKLDGNEYKKVPISSVFTGFDDAGDGAVLISPGEVALTFTPSVKARGGTYRMAFVAGNMSDYVKLDF